MSKKHLPRYCFEFDFRWNRRRQSDGIRMVAAIKGAEGKRLMYRTPKGAKLKEIKPLVDPKLDKLIEQIVEPMPLPEPPF